MPLLLRIRTKDGTERLSTEPTSTLAQLKGQIEAQFSVPSGQQALHRSEQAGPSSRKGAAFNPAEEAATLAALGLSNGELLFLDYQVERENQAKSQAYANDPFRKLAKEGELRAQGTTNWTLTNFLDYRSTKEFVLEAPPEPHTKFVQLDARATATLMNFMLGQAFSCMRVGHLYGKWAEDGEGAAGVEVHAIYEPKQDNTDKEIRLVDDAEGEAKADAVAAMLGLVRVGVVIAHPAREYAFTINELLLASKLHAAAVEKEGEKGKRFVTVKARPVLEHETEIEGVATVEAYQMTDQCVALCAREGGPAFTQSKTDPRVAKTAADCCFVVEKKEQRKAAVRIRTRLGQGASRAHATAAQSSPRAPPAATGRALHLPRLRRRAAVLLVPRHRLRRREPPVRAAGGARDGRVPAEPRLPEGAVPDDRLRVPPALLPDEHARHVRRHARALRQGARAERRRPRRLPDDDPLLRGPRLSEVGGARASV